MSSLFCLLIRWTTYPSLPTHSYIQSRAWKVLIVFAPRTRSLFRCNSHCLPTVGQITQVVVQKKMKNLNVELIVRGSFVGGVQWPVWPWRLVRHCRCLRKKTSCWISLDEEIDWGGFVWSLATHPNLWKLFFLMSIFSVSHEKKHIFDAAPFKCWTLFQNSNPKQQQVWKQPYFKNLCPKASDHTILVYPRVPGYLWGSMAAAYEKGDRVFCGLKLPEGLGSLDFRFSPQNALPETKNYQKGGRKW